jgi:hypothetical protein
VVVHSAIGHTSEIVIQKLLFVDLSGKSINHLVRKIAFSPKNGIDIFSTGGNSKHPSALFVNPRQIIEARPEEYTTVQVEFNRRVQIGALLFEIHREDLNKNCRGIAVYAGERLIFLV